MWVQILTATFKYLEREDLRGEKGKRYLLLIGPSPGGCFHLSLCLLHKPGRCDYPHLTNGEHEVQRGEATCGKSHSTFLAELGWEPGPVYLTTQPLCPSVSAGWTEAWESYSSWLSQGWEEPERIETLFVLSQRQVTWSSQFLANKGKFVMATSEEVQRFVWGGGHSGHEPLHWLEEAQLLFSSGFTLFWTANRHREETSEGALQIHYSN